MFLSASVLPVVLGTVWGARLAGAVDWLAFALALAAIACLHAAANVINDVCDQVTDGINEERIFPYTGGSRFIQNRVLTPGALRRWATMLLAAGVLFGGVLVYWSGALVLGFGVAGVLLGALYSLPPFHLASRGMGEVAVGLAFGVLPVVGAAWLQSGALTPGALLLSLPVALWVANILFANEVPDAPADEAAGKRTLVVRLGRGGAAFVYGVSSVAAFALVAYAVSRDVLAAWAAVPAFLLLAVGIWVARALARRASLKPAIELTLTIHALGTIVLALAAWR